MLQTFNTLCHVQKLLSCFPSLFYFHFSYYTPLVQLLLLRLTSSRAQTPFTQRERERERSSFLFCFHLSPFEFGARAAKPPPPAPARATQPFSSASSNYFKLYIYLHDRLHYTISSRLTALLLPQKPLTNCAIIIKIKALLYYSWLCQEHRSTVNNSRGSLNHHYIEVSTRKMFDLDSRFIIKRQLNHPGHSNLSQGTHKKDSKNWKCYIHKKDSKN